MARKENTGTFYIDADQKNDKSGFRVPGDLTGNKPSGEKNNSQPSYDLERGSKKHEKQYYIHIYNGWDVKVTGSLRGTRFNDSEMTKPVNHDNNQEINSNQTYVFEGRTGHSYIDLFFNSLTEIPTSGTLEVTFQHRY